MYGEVMHLKVYRYLETLHASAVTATGISVWFFAYLLNGSSVVQLVACAAGAIIGYFSNNLAAVVGGLITAITVWVAVVVALNAFAPNYRVSGLVVVWITAVVAVLCIALLAKRVVPIDNVVSLSGVLFVVTILSYLNSASRGWTSENSFDALVRNGEDNAAWLLALSRSVVEGETQLNGASGTSGGPGTGVFINLIRQSMDSFGQSSLVSSADNGLVLMRSYVLLGAFVAILWHVVTHTVLRDRDWATRVMTSVLAAVVSMVFVNGLAAVGHFSAVVAVVFLSSAVFFQIVEFTDSSWSRIAQRTLVTLSLVAAGQSWFPLTGLAILYVLVLLLVAVSPHLTKRPTTKQLQLFCGAFLVVGLSGWLAYEKLFSSFLQNVTNLDFITRNLTIPGGYSTVHPWLVLLAFTISVWWAYGTKATFDVYGIRALIVVLILPIVFLFTWSYFLSPFTPQYGAWKYLYIGVAVTAPLAVVVIATLISPLKPNSLQRLIPLTVFFVVVTFSPPWNHVRWAESVAISNGYEFSQTIVKELRRDSNRPVGCLATAENDASLNYIAYLCSRMSFGLGGFDEVSHRVWTAANICTIGVEQATSEFTMEYQRNFSVILFDGKRTSSFAECQAPSANAPNGWLSPIKWDVIRKLDQYGKVVEIPATKPK